MGSNLYCAHGSVCHADRFFVPSGDYGICGTSPHGSGSEPLDVYSPCGTGGRHRVNRRGLYDAAQRSAIGGYCGRPWTSPVANKCAARRPRGFVGLGLMEH